MSDSVPQVRGARPPALGVLGAAAQQPVFRGTGDAVRVFVTVTDRDGRLVTTLTRDDFEVRDEGKPQPITLFDNTPQPIRLIVMLDVSGSMEGNLPLLRAAAEQLFARLRPDDVARVGTFGHDITISPSFTRDADELRAALPDAIAPDAPTPLWRAIDEALDAFGDGSGDERRVILVLSDGKDSGPIGFRRALRQPGRGHRPRAPRGRDGLRHRHAQPRPAADAPGIGPGGLQAALTRRPARSRAGAGRGADRRRLHRDSLRTGPRRRVRGRRRRAAQPVPARLRAAEARRQGARHRRAGRQRGLKPRARKSYVAPKGQS